jgi:hypothetical protein
MQLRETARLPRAPGAATNKTHEQAFTGIARMACQVQWKSRSANRGWHHWHASTLFKRRTRHPPPPPPPLPFHHHPMGGGGGAKFYSGACVYVNAQPPQCGCSGRVTCYLCVPVLPANDVGLVFKNALTSLTCTGLQSKCQRRRTMPEDILGRQQAGTTAALQRRLWQR